jgi:hypothetical protein
MLVHGPVSGQDGKGGTMYAIDALPESQLPLFCITHICRLPSLWDPPGTPWQPLYGHDAGLFAVRCPPDSPSFRGPQPLLTHVHSPSSSL